MNLIFRVVEEFSKNPNDHKRAARRHPRKAQEDDYDKEN